MSVPMEWDEPSTEVVPLDLTVKMEDNYTFSEVEAERDAPEKLMEGVPLSQLSAQIGVESTPLDLSARRAFPLQPLSPVVVLSPKLQVESSPPQSPQPQCKDYWTPAPPSPMTATESLASLHGMYADAAAYRHLVLSSAVVPEYNPFPSILPTYTASEFHQHNKIQHQLQHLHIQQQQLLTLQNHLDIQQQLQFKLNQLHNQQKLQLLAAYGGAPLDPASMLPCSPLNTSTSSPSPSESNKFPSPTSDNHYHLNRHHQQQEQQRDQNQEHHQLNPARATDEMDVVDPEEVAAIYRHSDFLSFRHRYMESLGPPKNIEKLRQSNNNNKNNRRTTTSSSNNNDDDHGSTPWQHQYDQVYAMKWQKKNEEAKRLRDAKRQKYIDNQICVMYLTKKVREMKAIKRRLLKANSNIILAE